jgi:cytochrome oxidase Cu insertion factor (SCO1/SenC/PrrC family)
VSHWLQVTAVILALALATAAPAQTSPTPPKKEQRKDAKKERQGRLQVGETAPDFTLKDMAGRSTFTLARLQGRPVVLYFGSCT